MSDAVAEAPDTPAKTSKLPLILGVILALAGAGGGYFLSTSGLLFKSDDSSTHAETSSYIEPLPDIAYLAVEPITISLTGSSHVRHLRFRAQLEVNKAYLDEVELVLPRIVDVMNSYLQALDVAELQNAQSLARLRGQILRRIHVVVGEGRVRDLLVMEFVLN